MHLILLFLTDVSIKLTSSKNLFSPSTVISKFLFSGIIVTNLFSGKTTEFNNDL